MEDNNKLWLAVLGEIELTISRGNYVTWFKQSRLLDVKDDEVVIGVVNIFIKNQLENKYSDLIKKLLSKNGVPVKNITIKIRKDSSSHQNKEDDNEQKNQQTTSPTQKAPAVKPKNSLTHEYRQGLNEKYVFKSFVVGDGNEMAYAACQGVAKYPGSKYNPLYLYGGVGVGKTHLVQALGNEVLAKKQNAKVVYASTEQFVQEFVDALRFKRTTDFAKHYRSADVLIVDDMQFIAGKEKVQEEFFHTFNALHQANKQIVISSDQPPHTIPTLESRLKSRFVAGMTIDIQNPDLETRCAIVQTKALANGVDLDQETAEYLANLVRSNIRELEGALNRLLAFCEVRGLEPSFEVAESFLGSGDMRPKSLTANKVIEIVAKRFQISVSDIVGPKRDKDIVVPRQVAMYILRSELHLSFPKIARELGRKDHTTAIHSIDKIERESHLDPSLRGVMSEIRDTLYV